MANLPGHTWRLTKTVGTQQARFLYGCQRCPAVTLNAEPLPARWNAKCGTEVTR